jgi:arsenite methyltransferase
MSTMTTQTNDQARATVREHYAKIAESNGGACAPGCCGASTTPDMSLRLGYSADELAAVPEGANMGLGCGNPQAIAALRPGETVLDLGSGGGFDCFLAARQVGLAGRVIGVDMTAEMVAKARANATTLGATTVEFRLGEIEHLPVADGTADVIISNCVINLAPDKARVFREAFRALKPGGRLAVSDVVAIAELPAALRESAAALSGCVAGATTVAEVEAMLAAAGFQQIHVNVRAESRAFIQDWAPGSHAEDYVASATIEAVKPRASCCAPSCCAGEPAA